MLGHLFQGVAEAVVASIPVVGGIAQAVQMLSDGSGTVEAVAANRNGEVAAKAGFTGNALEGELETFSNLVISRKDEIKKQINRVEQMSSLGHWWDAKVPDSEISFYNFVSMTKCTNKQTIAKKIKKYDKFYTELERVINDLCRAAKDNNVDADEILKLYDTLSQMVEEAESGKMTTNSSTLYKIHSKFISRQEKLESMIKRVECVALKQQLKQMTRSWKQALKEINDLKGEMQEIRDDNRQIREQLDNITTANGEMVEYQQFLLKQNKLICDMVRELLNKE